jgi:hypothetical protein
MEKENIYHHAKIYKIISYSHPELVYYGSTTQLLLCKRMQGHKADYKRCKMCSSSNIIKYDDAKIILIEEYPCENKEQLIKQEAYYIKNNECVNKKIPTRTHKEYCEDNKNYLLKKKKEYYNINKELIAEKYKEIAKCECGQTLRKDNIRRHMKSKIHIETMNKLKV